MLRMSLLRCIESRSVCAWGGTPGSCVKMPQCALTRRAVRSVWRSPLCFPPPRARSYWPSRSPMPTPLLTGTCWSSPPSTPSDWLRFPPSSGTRSLPVSTRRSSALKGCPISTGSTSALIQVWQRGRRFPIFTFISFPVATATVEIPGAACAGSSTAPNLTEAHPKGLLTADSQASRLRRPAALTMPIPAGGSIAS